MHADRYFVLNCSCGYRTLSCGQPNEPIGACPRCRQQLSLSPVASTDDPALVIRATEAELESANYGRECEMVSPLFESIKSLMPSDKHLQLAWIISRILGS